MVLQPCIFSLIKHVSGFPLYTVSSTGEVRNLERGKSIAYSISHGGYYSVRCCKEKIHKRFLLHRLVLSSFCGYNPQRKYVDHIDDNPSNNNLTNLHWVTQSENIQKAYDLGRAKSPCATKGKFGSLHHNSQAVVAYDSNGNEVLRFESISLARAGGYSPNFYKNIGNRNEVICRGLIFKRA